MTIVLQIIIGIFVLGILVLIHECGHFLAAKSFGIRVLTFSIGFGKSLVSKTYGSTEYRISAIPFGGYVHMAGEHPEDSHTAQKDEFYSKPVWQRAVVASAGPLANMVTSIGFLWIMFMSGTPHDLYLDSSIVGAVQNSSPAFNAGIHTGDSIISINQKPIQTWDDIQLALSFQEKNYTITLVRDGEIKTIDLSLNNNSPIPEHPYAGMLPAYPAKIGTVFSGSAAQKSGLVSNDVILSINGTKIISYYHMQNIITQYDSTQGPLQITVLRADQVLTIQARPTYNAQENRSILGFSGAKALSRTIKYNPVDAVTQALRKTWEYTTMIFDVLHKLISKSVSPKQLAGPVGIIQMSGIVALGSFIALLNFMALIGINLAVINLFPLIITDGGVLLFLAIEAIRRKPLTLKTQMLMNKIALAFFVTLFLFVTFNDIMRIPLFLQLGK